MRKILIMSLMVIFIIFYVTACGVKSNNTSKSPLRQTKDMAENVYDAIKNHDSEKLKEQFCERLQLGKETAVDKIYEYIDGEIGNGDVDENSEVEWVSLDEYENLITTDIFSKVKSYLNGGLYE